MATHGRSRIVGGAAGAHRVHQASMTLGLVERGLTNVPEGEIFWQDPPPGKRVKRGRPIRVLVSFGAQNVAVTGAPHLARA